MRGKAMLFRCCIIEIGITPAYAGKRLLPTIQITEWQDHPRLCGEKVFRRPELLKLEGSPPPMRGKAQDRGERRCVHRITPAYAGKRTATAKGYALIGDHPRLCGEKLQKY